MRKPAERFAAPGAEPKSRSETATYWRLTRRLRMSWSLNIGTIAGTAVRVHVTFLLFLGWIFGVGWVAGGPEAAWQALAFLVLLFACVVAHEFGHIFTARAFGVSTPDVTLLPIGGVARLERIPEAPYEEFLVAIAGPLVNVAITIALIAVAGAQVNIGDLYAVESPDASMIDRLAAVNLFLAVFNMIPAFPMDGGRVLRALLAARLGFVRATKVAAFIGQGVAFALGVIGVFSNPMLIFIAVFVYLAASSEAHAVAVRAMSRGLPVSAAMTTHFATLTPAAQLEDAAQALLRTSQIDVPVIDAAGKPVGMLVRDDLMRARAQTTRTGGPRHRRHDNRRADHRPAPTAGRGVPPPAGQFGARRRSGRRQRTACRSRHLRNSQSDADAEKGLAQGRTARTLDARHRHLTDIHHQRPVNPVMKL
jgi:Zn-dependent protease/CBS domain-containing protein